jgi:hypothetical protein
MKRVALVAFPFVLFGIVLFAFVLVMRRRRDSVSIGEAEPADLDVDIGRASAAAGIDVLRGYDEEHETEIEARHGATLHITQDRLSFRQV